MIPKSLQVSITFIACLFLLLCAIRLQAQPAGWTTPFPGHQVISNLYAVGTYDLGVFLITSDEGHILINTGLEDSTRLIRKNIESLGFRLEDIKILLTMQAHWDHTAALAEIKEITEAKMWATRGDARVLADGGFSDPHFGGRETFRPVSVDKVIHDGEVIKLGISRLLVHEHPGHTEGSSSYSMQVRENGRKYNVAIANMGTINAGKILVGKPTYAGVADDFAKTYRKQKAMDVDVWVSAHASQYGLHEKYKPGQAYNPDTFVDPEGFLAAVNRLEEIYQEQLARDQRQTMAITDPSCPFSPALPSSDIQIGYVGNSRRTNGVRLGSFRMLGFIRNGTLVSSDGAAMREGMTLWNVLTPSAAPAALKQVSSHLDKLGTNHCVFHAELEKHQALWTLLSNQPLPGSFRSPNTSETAYFAEHHNICVDQGNHRSAEKPPCSRPILLAVSEIAHNTEKEYWATEPYTWDTGITVWKYTKTGITPIVNACTGCSD